ncbi:hypothetical protein [Acinetobacter rudis]|uniref:Uncharacterized protein n=1 Tax=Acinetobacter rudis TaxID=632955 RepID=A0AAW8J568_9GAMM|nr:hypothetical protein [Acinetobacter rudis]MDQ8934865.1 hypothetical protein [Acinetobacter rudis]MDQ9017266.1 hypothetical protein [Acinetobacter rudis]
MQKFFSIIMMAVCLAPTSSMAKPNEALVYEKSSVNVSSLNMEQILSRIYQTQALAVPEELEHISSAPKAIIQVRGTEKEQYLLSLLPVVSYKNTAGELRYLLVMQKNKYYDGQIMSCRACSADADMFIFKQIDGRYYLVNSKFNMTDLPGGDGELKLDLEQVSKNIQAFGPELTGSYFEAEFSGAGGQSSSGWYALLLAEQTPIQWVFIGDAGGDTSSFYADRPEMAWTTTSTLKVIPNKSTYYPIQVRYKGVGAQLKKAEISYKTFEFDRKTSSYIEKKSVKK